MTKNTMGCKIQEVDYAYDIKGWLKKINNPNALETQKDFFAMSLSYGGFPGNETITGQN
ncbi:hypothetical protein [Emticicia sp. C21]|uniref:hypothetical protein n=1 Tax=Emticicia sp. C21 TaxID=2302915 RepID=UPI0013145C30|nr:hypothetical protein [Emticicia sp. C21]